MPSIIFIVVTALLLLLSTVMLTSVMSSSYNDFLVSESAAKAGASIRRASFATQVASIMINAAAFTSNILSYGSKKRKSSPSNHAGRPEMTKTKKRERLDMLKYITKMDEREFQRKYRMDKPSFYQLLDIIKYMLPSDGR